MAVDVSTLDIVMPTLELEFVNLNSQLTAIRTALYVATSLAYLRLVYLNCNIVYKRKRAKPRIKGIITITK